MTSVNLRPVITVLQELADTLIEDEVKRITIRARFLRLLEDAEHTLFIDLQQSLSSSENNDLHDSLVVHAKIKAAKQRLEDACFVELSKELGETRAHVHMVNAVRRLCSQDLLKAYDEEPSIASHESARLLMPNVINSKDEGRTWLTTLTKFVPIVKWTMNYKPRFDLPGDLFAGCTVAFMTFPQTMGYAILAGLPPIYGLYASFVPVFLYSILGTSAEMSVGPAAMVALMIPDTLAPLAKEGSPEYIFYATFLSCFSGIILLIAGLVNGGFIVENILSVPLLTGWIQGAAVLIILSQLSGFLQIHIPSTSNTLVTVIESISQTIKNTNFAALCVGAVCLFLLFGSRKLGEIERFAIVKKIPLSLLVLAGVTALTKILKWNEKYDLAIIGTIPQGLPAPSFSPVDWALIKASFRAALAIAIIGFMEGISLAKKFAGLKKYKIDVSQELRALGIASSFFKAFPVTGSVTRTTVNYQSGSRTTYSSIINGLLVGAVLLFLSPLFYYTPKAALAAIVISAGLSLIDIHEIRFLWRIKAKYDLAQLVLIFIVTLFTGPELGAVIAILISVLQIIYRSTRPVCVTIGPVEGTSVYKPGVQFTRVTTKKGIIIVKLDSGLFFYTTAWLKENLYEWETKSPVTVNAIVLDASGIDGADSSGVHGLMEIIDQYHLHNINTTLMETLSLAGLCDKVGLDSFFATTHEAVQVAHALSYSDRMRLTVSLN